MAFSLFNWFCGRSQNDLDVPTLADWVEDGRKLVLLDSREAAEYRVSHLDGAIEVGYEDFDMRSVEQIPKADTIVVYCSVGYRSGKISERLRKAGYSNVYNLEGGIFDWVNRGLPLVDSAGPTERIHCYNRFWGTKVKRGEKVYE